MHPGLIHQVAAAAVQAMSLQHLRVLPEHGLCESSPINGAEDFI